MIDWIFAAAGAFSIIAAIMDWDWFMGHSKARFLISAFGRNGARVFYVLLGIFVIILSVLANGQIE